MGDLNQDGKPDLVASSSAGSLFWCQSNGNGTFAPAQVIASGLTGAASVSVADFNRDGLPDVIVAGGNKIQWYPNLGGGNFGPQQIIAPSINGACKLFVADLDRDGKLDVASASAGDGAISWHRNNGDGTFTSHPIANLGAGAVSVYAADVNRDGAPDLVCANAGGTVLWYQNNGDGTFGAGQTIASGAAAVASVFVADLNRDGRPDVLVSGAGKIAWYPSLAAGGFGVEQVISTAINGAISVFASDFNGDGLNDIVCASAGDNTISWFANTGGGNFGTLQVIASDVVGVAALRAADMDRDGDPDVLACSSSKISWYSNRRIHVSASFPTQNVISSTANYANAVFAADIDGDGLPDAISASEFDGKVAWYRNLGEGTFSLEHIISTQANGAWKVYAADLAGHGRMDVLAARLGSSDDQIVWFENLGGGTFGPQQILTTHAQTQWITSVVATDLDGDGKVDILSSSANDNKIAWYRNLGGGAFGSQQIISTAATSPFGVYFADLDGDGKLDVVSASMNDKKIAWYRNLGNGSFGLQQVITNTFVGAIAVFAADLDNDGRVDILAASTQTDSLVWFRNTGGGNFALAKVVAQGLSGLSGGVNSIFTSDLDRDGNIDVLLTATNFGSNSKVAWVRNLGGGSFGSAQVISSYPLVSAPTSVFAGDIGGRAASMFCQPRTTITRLLSIPIGVAASRLPPAAAPSSMLEGQRRGVLRVDLTHHGIAGDNDVALKTMTLLFEKAAGNPLSSTEASNLIRNVSIWSHAVSTDSSPFDVTRDSVVYKQEAPFALTNGQLVLDLSGADPNDFRASYSVPRILFVVVELKQDAASQSPNSFLVTNVTDQVGAVTGSDAQAGGSLGVVSSPSISTPLILIVANQAPSSSGLGNLTLLDTSKGSALPLFTAFSDPGDVLTYSISGNSNPGLFDFAGIDPASGLLVLNYRAGVKGDSQFTISATDSGGKTATATFHVTANLITTIDDWRANHYGSLATAMPGDLASYAFALSSAGANGPAMRLQNGSLVFSHRKPKYATDLKYSYQVSQDLVHWIPAVKGVHYFPYTRDVDAGTVSENCVLLVKWQSAFMQAGAQLITPALVSPPSTTGSTAVTSTSAFNNAPTTTGIADVTVLDTATATTIPLFNSFNDWEDAPQQMTYLVAGNTNTSLFDSVSIDASNGLLNLKYKTGALELRT